MLDEFGNELDQADSRIDSTMKRVAKVLNLNNGKINFSPFQKIQFLFTVYIEC